MNIDADDFTLLGLHKGFALERSQLDAAWKALQARVHPDRFAAEGGCGPTPGHAVGGARRQAHQRLKDPLKRAAYLCELAGVPVQSESNTAMPGAFLMQQMQWREALEEADTARPSRDLVRRSAARPQGPHRVSPACSMWTPTPPRLRRRCAP